MNLRNVYDSRRIWKLALIAVSLILVAGFIWISNNLVKDLAKQERDRMEIWADATKELASMSNEPATDEQGNLLMPTDINFLFSIIERNHNIPVLLVDDNDQILQYRNFNLPEPIDSLNPMVLSDANEQYLQKRLVKLKKSPNKIDIKIDKTTTQHLYYEDSDVLCLLSLHSVGCAAAFPCHCLLRPYQREEGGAKQGVGGSVEGNGAPTRHPYLVADGVDATARINGRGQEYGG